MAARFSFREGFWGVRVRCIRTSNAPIGAPTRSIHKVISISGSSGAAHKSAAKTKSTTKPAHLKYKTNVSGNQAAKQESRKHAERRTRGFGLNDVVERKLDSNHSGKRCAWGVGKFRE